MTEPVQPSAGGPAADLAAMLQPLVGTESLLARPDGTRLRVVEAGSGPDVLLVHGFAVNADEWSLVQPALVARGRRVIAYDHRCHGQSTCGTEGLGSAQLRDDLAAVADAFGITDAVIVCHSMGNFVALPQLADAGFASRFRAGVLVSPTTGHAAKGAPAARVQMPLIRWGLAQRLSRIRPIGNVFARASLGSRATPDIVEATRRAMVETPTTLAPILSAQISESIVDALPDVDLPVAVLTGEDDKTTPAWHANLIAERAPQTRIHRIPGTGHMLNWEAPEEICAAVAQMEHI